MSTIVVSAGLEALYQDHHHWLQRSILRRLHCAETAADLTHDTFVRLLIRNEDPAVFAEPRAYLSRIASGLVANHWRRHDIERAYLETLRQRPCAQAPSPEARYLVIETLCQIDALLHGLPAKVRQAFLLSRLDGVRYAQIADALGVSERMVKKYMARAMLHCLQVSEDVTA